MLCVVALLLPMHRAAADYGVRDVINSAWDHPLVTDAEVVRYITNRRAVLETDGGRVLIRYPGITGVRAGDEQLPTAAADGDLVAVQLAAGTHEIEVLTDRDEHRSMTTDLGLELTAGPVADSPERFAELAEAAGPGDEIVIADGIHRDWRVTIAVSGSTEAPIIIRSQTPGGAIFQGNSRFGVTGSHIVLRGLRFEHCGPGITVHLEGANDCRVTQCQFFHCGNPRSTFGHILRVDMDSHRNRVDHCYFTGSKSMSVGQRITGDPEVGTDNRYDHNIFRDIFRYWINGQENIQLGQNQRDFGGQEPRALVERNLFDHAWADSEIISSKSSRNIVRHNVAAHCKRAAFVLRGGDHARFEGNVVYNCGGGVRVLGTGHEIVNNLLVDNHTYGVHLGTGTAEGNMQVAADDTLVAFNTIVGSPQGVHSMPPTEARPHVPQRCRILNNLIVGSGGRLMDTDSLEQEETRRNLFWGQGSAEIGREGEDAIIEDPLLSGDGIFLRPSESSPAIASGLPVPEVTHDRLGRPRPRGDAPDIGAEELGAPEPETPVILPPIPPEPLLEPGLYRGESLHLQDGENPPTGWSVAGETSRDGEATVLEDAAIQLDVEIPDDVVVRWRYQPQTWATVATLAVKDAEGEGWSLTWGGADDEGRPLSGVDLRDGSDDLLATGADVVYYYRDFRPGYGGMRGPEEPLENRWYDFTLLLRGDELYLLLGPEGREAVPVMVWKSHEVSVNGPLTLSLAQEGIGRWRGLEIHALDYTGDQSPPAPPNLTAQQHGGSRVELTWGEPAYDARGYIQEVHRSTEAGFTPAAETVVASAVRGSRWDDFSVEPQSQYYYAVRARNAFGLTSEFTSVETGSGEGGASYLKLEASDLETVEPPMVLASDVRDEPDFIWAPGADFSQQNPPDDGIARFHFTIDETGAYHIWGLVLAPDMATDSFWVAFNGEHFRDWHTGIHQQWGWSRIAGEVQLEAGAHMVSFKHREPGTKLAAILITNDLAWGPEAP